MIELPENPYKPVLNETDEVWANIVDVRDKTMLRWFVGWLEDHSLQNYARQCPWHGTGRFISENNMQELKDRLAELEKK